MSSLKTITSKEYHLVSLDDLLYRSFKHLPTHREKGSFIVISNQRIFCSNQPKNQGLRSLILEVVVLKMKEFILISNLGFIELPRLFLVSHTLQELICGVLLVSWQSSTQAIHFSLERMRWTNLALSWRLMAFLQMMY
jgi:hypothetical protein